MLTNTIESSTVPIRTLICSIIYAQMSDPNISKLGGPMPEVLANALSDAKAADDIYGPSDLKACTAWNKAEKIAMDMNVTGYTSRSSMPNVFDKEKRDHLHRYKESAMKAHHEFSAIIDTKSLEDGLEALMKLEHLARLVGMEKVRLDFHFRDNEAKEEA